MPSRYPVHNQNNAQPLRFERNSPRTANNSDLLAPTANSSIHESVLHTNQVESVCDVVSCNVLNTLLFYNTLNSNISHSQRFHSTPIELMSLFLLSLFDCFRIRLAVRGNRCEKAAPMAWASSLCCPIAIGYVFFLKTNTNILVHDKLLNAVPLSFIAAEFALSVLAIIVFQRKG